MPSWRDSRFALPPQKNTVVKRFPLALPAKKCIIEEIRDRAVKTLRLYEYASSATASSSYTACPPSRCSCASSGSRHSCAAGCSRYTPSRCSCAACARRFPSRCSRAASGSRCSRAAGCPRCAPSRRSCAACSRCDPTGCFLCSAEFKSGYDGPAGSAFCSLPPGYARSTCDAASRAYDGAGYQACCPATLCSGRSRGWSCSGSAPCCGFRCFC